MATGRKVLLSLKNKRKPAEAGRERDGEQRDKLPDKKRSPLSQESKKLFYKFISNQETNLPTTNLLCKVPCSSSSSSCFVWSPLPSPDIKKLTQSYSTYTDPVQCSTYTDPVQVSTYTDGSSCTTFSLKERRDTISCSSSSGIVSCKSTGRQTILDHSIVKRSDPNLQQPLKNYSSLKHRKTRSSSNNKSINGGIHSSLIQESVTGTMVNGTDTRDIGRHSNSRYGNSSDDAIRIDDEEEFDKLCSCIDLTIYK